MSETRHSKDYELARRVCDELIAGNRQAIKEVHDLYQPLFLNFLRRRLRGSASGRIDDVLSRFWIELMTGSAICAYKGGTSLKRFLLGTLHLRAIDEHRSTSRHKQRFVQAPAEGDSRFPEDEQLSHRAGRSGKNGQSESLQQPMTDVDDERAPADETLIRKQRHRIINEALLDMSDIHPKDADRVRMFLQEMTYIEMARIELAGTDADQTEIKKKETAIKKQFTRPGGTLDKYKIILERKARRYQTDLHDLID